MKIEYADANEAPPSAEADLVAFEFKHKTRLPEVYRNFLKESSGGTPSKDLSEFAGDADYVAWIYGIHGKEEWKTLEYAVKTFGHDLSKFLPVGISPGGNYFLLKLTEPNVGSIHFWDHELEDYEEPTFEELILIAKDFESWIENLKEVDD